MIRVEWALPTMAKVGNAHPTKTYTFKLTA